MRPAYYNENSPHAAQWLRNLIASGFIPSGDVDDRSIADVQPGDLAGYGQCHFFAGLGGWAYAARLAGWPDDRPLWTGSCPCQPWSIAGERAGAADSRHLWPEWFRLIRGARPAVVMGEQVARAARAGWWREVAGDLARIGYARRAAIVPACAVGAPIRRDRLWFVAEPGSQGLSSAECAKWDKPGEASAAKRTSASERNRRSPWRDHGFSRGADGITRMVKPGVCLLDHGISNRMDVLSAIGNAIVPQVAAEVIGAYLDAESD